MQASRPQLVVEAIRAAQQTGRAAIGKAEAHLAQACDVWAAGGSTQDHVGRIGHGLTLHAGGPSFADAAVYHQIALAHRSIGIPTAPAQIGERYAAGGASELNAARAAFLLSCAVDHHWISCVHLGSLQGRRDGDQD